jgi:hypothetical protein
MRFRKIFVPLDGTPTGQAALPTPTIERPWYVFAQLPSGEELVLGEPRVALVRTPGAPGPRRWLARFPRASARPGFFYGPEPSWRVQSPRYRLSARSCSSDPSGPLPTR